MVTVVSVTMISVVVVMVMAVRVVVRHLGWGSGCQFCAHYIPLGVCVLS